jgi:hypothetical protein
LQMEPRMLPITHCQTFSADSQTPSSSDNERYEQYRDAVDHLSRSTLFKKSGRDRTGTETLSQRLMGRRCADVAHAFGQGLDLRLTIQ